MEREKEQEKKEGAQGEEIAEEVNYEDQSDRISELEQSLLEAKKVNLVQRRKAFNAESLVEEKDLENKELKAEITKLKRA